MRKLYPYGRQEIDSSDIDAVVDALRSDYLTQGPRISEFEANISKIVDSKYCAAFNSATSALHVACLALNLNNNSTVWTSPLSFVASANCALYCGSSIDFVDIDPRTGNMCITKLKEKLRRAEADDNLPDVLVVVHYAGTSCDMEIIHKLATQYHIKIIEDASHAIGGSYHGRKVGSCSYSDITIFSFHPVKIVTTCEGGCATTNNKALYKQMKLYGSHGITKDEAEFLDECEGPWYYEQQLLGFNLRMNDVQAALGISQLKKLKKYTSRRNEIAKLYAAKFNGAQSITPLSVMPGIYSSYHLYVIRLPFQAEEERIKLMSLLKQEGILTQVHYRPIYLNPFYRYIGFNQGYCPQSEAFAKSCLSIPMFPTLSNQDADYISDTVLKYADLVLSRA